MNMLTPLWFGAKITPAHDPNYLKSPETRSETISYWRRGHNDPGNGKYVMDRYEARRQVARDLKELGLGKIEDYTHAVYTAAM